MGLKESSIVQEITRFRHGLAILAAAAVLALAGVWGGGLIERGMKERMSHELSAVLAANAAALEYWIEGQKTLAQSSTRFLPERPLVADVLRRAREGVSREALLAMPELARLRRSLIPYTESHDFTGLVVVDPAGLVVFADREDLIGRRYLSDRSDFVARAMQGETFVSVPFFEIAPSGGNGRPVQLVVSPLREGTEPPAAALGWRVDPGKTFSRILKVARAGKTGESYAFDRNGLLLSESRFQDHLRKVGLVRGDAEASEVLNLEIRDPGGNLLQGYAPATGRRGLPLTRMAAAAVSGQDGVDVSGYRDYRGVPVVGAWMWLPRYGFGLATEVDVDEAFATLILMRRAFWAVFGLLAAAAAGALGLTFSLDRLRRRARKAERLAERLGQYTIEEKIGEGGMGAVYRARHTLLRRPTAVKILRPGRHCTLADIARFEREVQSTSQLTHPNTVQIYDYGRTDEEVFYYAMEYLDGIDLERLVRRTGVQPEARVIHILRQACGSLHEAHGFGLVHRDVKPANMMLCDRAGSFDVVKLLDFGLAKNLARPDLLSLSSPDILAGTPAYMAPEALDSGDRIDARADLYALGAVGYFLVTAHEVFEGESLAEILRKQAAELPIPPSSRRGEPVTPDLERILLRCLEKDPARRFPSARALDEALALCPGAGSWGTEEARRWRLAHPELVRPGSGPDTTTDFKTPSLIIELGGRLRQPFSEDPRRS